MANKNKHVIISYFPNKDAATEAAHQLKSWDKAHDDIKLGGIGILTWEKEKIKTRLVGNRAAGTGAKWGTILGVAAAILTVPVGLGGIAVGLAGGALVGSMFHKHLGLKDADKARLETHLRAGGAVVVVMADAGEVAPTMAEISHLGGKVENYEVPEVTVVQMEETSESTGDAATVATLAPAAVVASIANDGAAAPEQQDILVDERTVIAESDIPAVVGLNGRLQSVEGIGPERSAALAGVGIKTRQHLLERGATPEGRAEIASQSLIGQKHIDGWVSAIDLSRVKGIGAQYAGLLVAAGVTGINDLAQRSPASLRDQLAAVNETSNKVRELPGASQVEDWVSQAKALPKIVNQ
jgi:predicted flap endonuclease-1-like 5' DNA nuclease